MAPQQQQGCRTHISIHKAAGLLKCYLNVSEDVNICAKQKDRLPDMQVKALTSIGLPSLLSRESMATSLHAAQELVLFLTRRIHAASDTCLNESTYERCALVDMPVEGLLRPAEPLKAKRYPVLYPQCCWA